MYIIMNTYLFEKNIRGRKGNLMGFPTEPSFSLYRIFIAIISQPYLSYNREKKINSIRYWVMELLSLSSSLK